MELDTLGDKIFSEKSKGKDDYQKTALFLIMSDTDPTFNFLISMIYTQLFIPNLEKLVATIRSREISACLVLQAQSQLKAIYKDNADTIIGNMDTRIFLGGSEPTTIKELNAALGKETIDSFNTSDTRGNSPSYGTSYQKLGHELMSQDEIAVMDGGKCILQLRGVRPFFSDKYDITKHPNYKYLSDADPRNAFNIEKFLSTQLRPKPEESYEVFEINVDEEDGDGEDGIPAFVPDL